MKAKFWLPFLVASFTISCTNDAIIHHYETVSDEGWNRKDTLRFPLPEITKEGNYSVEVGLRFNSQYPYEGVWIEVETELKNPHFIRKDTICIATANNDGRPKGQGVVFLQTDTLLTTLPLTEGQAGEIRLRHIMQRETLTGIRDVGLKVKVKSEE